MKAAIYLQKEQVLEKLPSSTLVDESTANLVLCFGSKDFLVKPLLPSLQKKFSNATIALCSSSGEIFQNTVHNNALVVAALHFDKTKTEAYSVNIKHFNNAYLAAIALAKKLPKTALKHILVLSDGSKVNGSELVKGLTSQVEKGVSITGGLAGDGANFNYTLVGLNAEPQEGEIVAIGFYGNHIRITHGSQSGWDIFGLEKRVTNASGNVLVELENQNALELYKKYLGPEAEKLPGSALLYPLSVIIPETEKPVVRTILSINEEDKTMTFAGDIPVGSRVRFMKTNVDGLIKAAAEAAFFTVTKQQFPFFRY
jgi:hypothetical protein